MKINIIQPTPNPFPSFGRKPRPMREIELDLANQRAFIQREDITNEQAYKTMQATGETLHEFMQRLEFEDKMKGDRK